MHTNVQNIKVGLADDHNLLRSALASLIDSFENCKVIIQAGNGTELTEQVKNGKIPDVLLLDLNMPGMDGYETAIWLQQNYPQVLVLMLTMYDSEITLVRLLHAGVRGFLKKDIHPSELKSAIESVINTGYYYSHHSTGKLVNLLRQQPGQQALLDKTLLTEQDLKFIEQCCSEKTYKEIAVEMGLNPRAVDNLRDSLFQKLEVKSRVGLAMFAFRNGLKGF